jgi:UDP-glucose-4-epimerase GalE
MRVLVVGGAGYIGSHVFRLLTDSGIPAAVFDNLSTGHLWAVPRGALIIGDIADPAAVRRAVAKTRATAVVHLAARLDVAESVREPLAYWRANVGGTLALLEALNGTSVRSLVFSSTCATYGNPETLPLREDHPQRPINPYGETKLAIERLLADQEAQTGINSVALRYFNAAGAHPRGDIGEDHEPEIHVIPRALNAVVGRIPEITVFGTDYPTRDGTCVRDYVHVCDLATAHLQALNHLERGGPSTALNLGNGSGFTVLEVLAAVQRVTGRDVPVTFGERRPGDPPALVGSSERALAFLGWRPEYPGIDVIVETAWRWHQARFGAPPPRTRKPAARKRKPAARKRKPAARPRKPAARPRPAKRRRPR